MKRIGLLLAAAIFIFTGCSTPLTEREAKLPARKTIVYGSDLTVSRALAAKMTALFLKNGTLSSPVIQTAAYQDVGKEDWFFPYVQIVSQAGLMQDESGAFRPNDPLTVGQAMTLLEQLGYESKQAGNKDDPISLALWQEWFLAATQQAGLPTQETEFSVFATASLGGLSPWQAASSAGLICHEGFVLDPYVDCTLKGVLWDGHLVALQVQTAPYGSYPGAWVTQENGQTVISYTAASRTFPGHLAETGVADVSIVQGEITQLTFLSSSFDTLLSMQEGKAVLEQAGAAEFDGFCYNASGSSLEIIPSGSSVKAYYRGKTLAALVRKVSSPPKTVRIALSINGQTNLDGAILSAPGGLWNGEKQMDRYPLTCEKESRIVLTTIQEGEMITLSLGEVQRQYPWPIEVWQREEMVFAVVCLPLEDAVAAALMAESTQEGAFGQALAILCRSEIVAQIESSPALAFGANDIGDPIPPTAKAKDTSLATAGQILMKDHQAAAPKIFSVSWGAYEREDGQVVAPIAEKLGLNLSLCDDFEAFLHLAPAEAASSSPWYRWNLTLTAEELKKTIDRQLKEVQKAYPGAVLVRGEDGAFQPLPIETLGDITQMTVVKRSGAGRCLELMITGTQAEMLCRSSEAICALLSPQTADGSLGFICRMDGSIVSDQNHLPSPFFRVNETHLSDGSLSSVTLLGGGYGSGQGICLESLFALTKEGQLGQELFDAIAPGFQLTYLSSARN